MRSIRQLITGLVFIVPIALTAQRPAPVKDSAGPVPAARPASATTARSTGPKPYSEVIPSTAKSQKGLIAVHQVADRYFFEIPDSVLNRDILVVNRISKAAAGGRAAFFGYAGDQIGDNVIRFEKGPNNRIFLKNISYQEMSSDTTADGMYRSVMNSNLQPIAAAFDIKTYPKDSAASVIDMTDFINGDNDILFFASQRKRGLALGALQNDRSYIENVRVFPMNVEIRTVKTYNKTAPPSAPGSGAPSFGGGSAGEPATYELNSSMVMLPKVPMQPRFFDPRVGYFATGFVDFDANPQGVKRVLMATRWRLEPKDADVEKYKRGELVEPKKPIIFYIDPATPKKWIPYLIKGVDDWQVAFEQAGFKNAIMAKVAPSDPSWSLEDARHSAIVYKPSDIPNASGPHVHDPRSGEIIETHINWYHNVMLLLRNWYFVQTAAVDPRARSMKFEDSLMGQLIRFVSSHEVGHTLGLRHNFGSSSTVPVEKLRDKKWVEANGHTPSIMDYARFNYVAQPEDNISEAGLFPRIGDYDKWAIEWGYKWIPEAKSATQETPILNKLVIEKLKNKRLWFGTEQDPNDPRTQNEDLGDNAMLASSYGIKNLKRIVPNLLTWTRGENEGYDNARLMFQEVTTQFNRYLGHVSKNIGGITTTPRMVEEEGTVYDYVSKATQKEAMKFLQDNAFKTPMWLIDQKLYSLAGVGGMSTIATIQENVLNRVLSPATLDKLLQFEAFNPQQAYKPMEMLEDLKAGVWTEMIQRRATDIYRRNLQKIYTERLIALLTPPAQPAPSAMMSRFGPAPISKTTDAISLVKGHARGLVSQIKASMPLIQDQATKLHLQDVADRLTLVLNPVKTN